MSNARVVGIPLARKVLLHASPGILPAGSGELDVAELTDRVTLVEHMIDDHGRKIDDLREAVMSLEDRMDQRFQRFEEQIDRRFDHLEGRFTAIDARFTLIDQCFHGIDQRFAGIDQRFDRLTNLLTALLIAIIGGMGGIIAAILKTP